VSASRALLRSDFESEAVTTFLAEIGGATDADRAYVFENERRDGMVYSSQRFEWNSGSARPQIDNPELQELPMSELLPAWLEAFDRGDPYHRVVADLPQSDRDILEPQSIVSILVCPIRVNDEVWGFVGFDDCRRARVWNADELRILGNASKALAAALRHRSIKERLSVARLALEKTIGE